MDWKEFNAFLGLKETQDHHPHARTLRSSLYIKFQDSFLALCGILASNKNLHVGIFDYLTLGLPLVLFYLLHLLESHEENNLAAKILWWPILILNLPLLLVRVTFAIITTLVFSPLIALIHGISRLIAKDDYTQALAIIGITAEGGNEMSLGAVLGEEDIENLSIEVVSANPYNKGALKDKYKLNVCKWIKKNEESVNSTTEKPLLSVLITKDDAGVVKQSKNIHALFNLNLGQASSRLENTNQIPPEDKQALFSI